MSKVLVCGSVSYDTITVSPDEFGKHIVPQDSKAFNYTFHVTDMRREFGGCAANICYNLNLLGHRAYPAATVGNDFNEYAAWMLCKGMPRDYIMTLPDARTAHYFITVDVDENQIVIFYPGAMAYSDKNTVDYNAGFELVVLAPDSVKGMLHHAAHLAEGKIPFIFDPGPVIHLLKGDEISYLIDLAKWVILNKHEWDVLREKTNLVEAQIISTTEALIITEGGAGSSIITKDENILIPALQVDTKDPTGCGDAYRAGIVSGILNGYDWHLSGRVANLMGAICAESGGSQNHIFSVEEFIARYRSSYNESIEINEVKRLQITG